METSAYLLTVIKIKECVAVLSELYHPWLSEINAPVGYQEVTDMPTNPHC